MALLLQLVAAATASAQREVRSLFPERPAGFVTDVAGVVPAEARAAITTRIEALRAATGAEIAVVTLPTLGQRAPVDVAVAIGRAWGVGARAEVGDPRRNAGIVVLLVPRRQGDENSGQLFIATGQGLEGAVPDAAAGRIRDRMIPHLARGDYGEGLRVGVGLLADRIEREMGVGQAAGTEDPDAPGGLPAISLFALLIPLIVVVVLAMVAARTVKETRGKGRRRRRGWGNDWWIGGGGFGGGGFGGGGFGGFGGGGGGGFGGFGGGGGFSGGGAGGRF